MWFEVAIITTTFAVGNILFGELIRCQVPLLDIVGCNMAAFGCGRAVNYIQLQFVWH